MSEAHRQGCWSRLESNRGHLEAGVMEPMVLPVTVWGEGCSVFSELSLLACPCAAYALGIWVLEYVVEKV